MPTSALSRVSSALRARLIGVTLVGLAGCAAAPPPAPPVAVPAVPLPAEWSAPALVGEAVDLTSWWRAFGDSALDGLVERALTGSPDIDAAAARVRSAQAMAQELTARLGPQVSLVGDPQQTANGRSTYFQAGLEARWDIPLSDRLTASRGVAEADKQLALADEQSTRATLVAEVARTYFEMRAAEREQHLLEQLAAVADERERLTRVLLQTKQVGADEVQASVLAAVQARAAVLEPAGQATLARTRLGVLLGDLQAPLPPPVPDADVPARSPLGLTALPADLVRQRPGIRRAEQTVLRAAHASGLARADAQPRISLAGLVGLSAAITGPASGAAVRAILSAGPSFSMSLFDGGALAASQRARDADFDVATALYRQAVLQGVAEAQSALLELDRERQRAVACARVEELVRQRSMATDVQARLGLATGFQRADARGAAVQARRETARAGLAEQVAYVALFTAFGGASLPVPTPVPAP
ncbi:MAG: TolC family protein [Rhizobacter sp.]